MLCPLLSFGQDYVGKWSMEVPDEAGNMTTIIGHIKADNTYALDFGADGSVEVNGKYEMKDGQMHIHDVSGSECTGVGVYKIKVEGSQLTMTRVSDACEGRGGPEGVMVMKKA